MLFNWRSRQLFQPQMKKKFSSEHEFSARKDFFYSWIITGKLAVGPIPRYEEDWILLEENGIKKRFSCCYSDEHIFAQIPEDWLSREVSLPDHRCQEELTHAKLKSALTEAINLFSQNDEPMYLHCFAGQERSTLLATGIVSLTEGKDLFDALAYIRQCYPKARPLYEHLDMLEKVLKNYE